MGTDAKSFITTILSGPMGGAYLDLPFDPSEEWGAKDRHHITGTVNGRDVRGPVTYEAGAWRLALGPAWLRGELFSDGAQVNVCLSPEGPQRDSLAPDLASALEANPDAAAFFDSLATFYRKGYLRWLDGALRRPDVRKQRIQEWVMLLKSGKKTRD